MLPHSYRKPLRMALGSIGILLLSSACFWTLRLSWASHVSREDTSAALARAIGVTPDDAALLTRYAAASGQGDDAVRALERAVSLNPAAWAAWTRLGMHAEAREDFDQAEYYYRQAAGANRQFQAAWTLTNYYFRRENRREFDLWAARALQMSYGDARPIFELCWRSEPSPDMVLRAVAGRRDLLRQYLAYLVAAGRLDAADGTARQLLPQAREDDVPNLVSYCGRVLETGTAARALVVWNDLCRRRLLRHAVLDPAGGQSLTNGGFEEAPSSLGFDWRIIPWTGVSVVPVPSPAGLRVSFSGEQPESCEILTQYLPVMPGRAYRLAYEYRTPGLQHETGIRWRVYGAANGAELVPDPPQLASEGWERQETRFSTGPDCRLARLALIYQRASGTTRIEGSLWLRHIRLD